MAVLRALRPHRMSVAAMHRMILTAASAVALALVAAPAASTAATATRATGPCATQRELFEKENIQFDMHQEQVEWLYSEVCRRTG